MTVIDQSDINAWHEYATIMLLLFYPFQDNHDFGDAEGQWTLFCKMVDNGMIYSDAKQIMKKYSKYT